MTHPIRYDAVSQQDHDSLDVESQRALDLLAERWSGRNDREYCARKDTEEAEDPNAWGFYGTYETDAGGL